MSRTAEVARKRPAKRSHKNKVSRLTAKERAAFVVARLPPLGSFYEIDRARRDIERALQAHAREAVDRHKRKQAKVSR